MEVEHGEGWVTTFMVDRENKIKIIKILVGCKEMFSHFILKLNISHCLKNPIEKHAILKDVHVINFWIKLSWLTHGLIDSSILIL